MPSKQKSNQSEGGKGEPSPKKKANKQKNMMALIHTVPKNLEEQREAFFESDCT